MSKVVYSHIENAKDIGRINRKIRSELRSAKTRKRIVELKRRSGYLITLTHSPAWKKRYNVSALRKRAKSEYNMTVELATGRMQKLKV